MLHNTRVHTETHATPTRFVVEREIVGTGRFRSCWLVPENKEREDNVRSVRHDPRLRNMKPPRIERIDAGRCSVRDSGLDSNPYLGS